MSNAGKPVWPAGPMGFMPFPIPGLSAPEPAPPPTPNPATFGMDVFNSMWSQLPGASQVPGFMVPTTDVDELDKRLSDLRAAEQWVEVNLNVLRATIQGLEVQRNTIAALRSMSASPPPSSATPDPEPAATAASAALPAAAAVNDWLGQLQAQFNQVARAALATPAKPAAKRRSEPAKRSKSKRAG